MALYFQQITSNITASKLFSLLFLISFLVIIISHGSITEAAGRCERPANSKDEMIIGVPERPFSDKLVKWDQSISKYTGFCISVFEEVLNISQISHKPIHYVGFDGTYDELVECVANKTYDAVVGDVTILAGRWNSVEFTVPYIDSGLAMLAPIKPETWMFLKPFSPVTWGATLAILMYTMFVVWFIEHRFNSEFGGKPKDQLGSVLWFTFSSLFFSHREEIRSNYTRVVIVVWLFLVLVLTKSYTASLSSMITIERLQPITGDIGLLLANNATVGRDDITFMKEYLMKVLKFKENNIAKITAPHNTAQDYLNLFKSGNISAAFLETPYVKEFVSQHCNRFSVTEFPYRFGGFGFVFPKNYPMISNVSKAILQLSENGRLKILEEQLLGYSPECWDSKTRGNSTTNSNSLKLERFKGLYYSSGATSTICFLLFIIHSKFKDYRRPRRLSEEQGGDIGSNHGTVANLPISGLERHPGRLKTF